jgi:hypothetical protein
MLGIRSGEGGVGGSFVGWLKCENIQELAFPFTLLFFPFFGAGDVGMAGWVVNRWARVDFLAREAPTYLCIQKVWQAGRHVGCCCRQMGSAI